LNVHGLLLEVLTFIAQCLQLGLLRPSFIPGRPQRELRELTRGRKSLIEDQARTTNRIEFARLREESAPTIR
jgi:hypothetical protein